MKMAENSSSFVQVDINKEQTDDCRTATLPSCTIYSTKISNGPSELEIPLFVARKSQACFAHIPRSSSYCSRIHELQKCSFETTELKLVQKFLKRLTSLTIFKKKLENQVEREFLRLNSVYSCDISLAMLLDVGHYLELFEEGKKHLFSWLHVESKIHLLKLPVRRTAVLELRIKKLEGLFFCLLRNILHYLHKLAVTGIQLLANSNFKQLLSSVDLPKFFQVIKMFNDMVSVERKYLRDSKYMYKKKNMYGLINYPFPTLDLVIILSVICEQRSNLLARLVHENLVQEVAVLEKHNLLSTTEEFSWNSDGQLTTNELLHEKTASIRFGRLRTIIKKYGQKEKEFLQQLVNAASVNAFPCNETPIKRESKREFCYQHSQLHDCENNSVKLMYLAGQSRQTLKILFDGCALSHIDNSSLSEEKNIHCLISIYDNDLWLRFSSKFYSELEGLTWQHFVSKTIGPVFSWSTVTTMEIKHQIEKLESAGL